MTKEIYSWAEAMNEIDRLRSVIQHVVSDSPGTPDSVKKYLVRELEGSWGDSYESAVVAGPPEGYIVPEGDERCDFAMDACVCMKRKGHDGLHACAHGGWRG